jgi:hypothetical protein
MKHQVQFQDYREVGKTVHMLPDGRRLMTPFNQQATIVDLEGHEIIVSSSELMALIAVSEISFPKKIRSTEWLADELTASPCVRK